MKQKNIRAIKRRVDTKEVTVKEALQDYYASTEYKKLALTTQRNYKHFLTVFADWCAGHKLVQNRTTKDWKAVQDEGGISLHAIDDQAVHVFLEHIKTTHKPSRNDHEEISTWTLATYVKCIKVFLYWCVLDNEYTEQVKGVVVDRIKKPAVVQDIIETFTADQINDLLDACKKEESEHLQMRDRAILYLLLDSGVRAEELTKVRIGDVHLNAQPYIEVMGKGSKPGEVGMGDKARRALSNYVKTFRVPTVESAFESQKHNLSGRQKAQALTQEINKAPLFVNRYGQKLTVSGLYQIIRRLGEWAYIDETRCSPHTFRHTFAKMYMENGGDVYRLSKLMRHTSVRTTEAYLRDLMPNFARKDAPSIVDKYL